MRVFLPFMFLLSMVVVVGCGGQVVVPETNEDTVTQSMRPILERVVETGDLEIANELQSYIEEDLASVDQAKADALMKDFRELQSMSDQNAVKAKAKEMLSKL
ncbi:MAG: hypothetical protein H8E44_48170 [Planctomycetes bacterium]|nr:hypothetical protein [Planctomycetota bacterium]MBL7043831.1 hypothetical protein [Pirellulaceae bacterium]